MILASLLLVVAAAAMLVAAVASGPGLGLVYASIAVCLLAAVLLAIGVARSRPTPAAWSRPTDELGPTWSGAGTSLPPDDDEEPSADRP